MKFTKINGTYFLRGPIIDRVLDAIGALFGRRFTGSTFFSWLILLRSGEIGAAAVAHELAHRDQDRRHGFWKFRYQYYISVAKVGYLASPFEIEARQASLNENFLSEAMEILTALGVRP